MGENKLDISIDIIHFRLFNSSFPNVYIPHLWIRLEITFI